MAKPIFKLDWEGSNEDSNVGGTSWHSTRKEAEKQDTIGRSEITEVAYPKGRKGLLALLNSNS